MEHPVSILERFLVHFHYEQNPQFSVINLSVWVKKLKVFWRANFYNLIQIVQHSSNTLGDGVRIGFCLTCTMND